MKRIISISIITFIILTFMPCAFAEDGVQIDVSGGDYINIAEPLEISVSYADMEECVVYIGANEIARGEAEADTFSASADISSVPYMGNATLTAVAIMADGAKVSANEEIYLVKLTDSISKFNQPFTDLNQEYESAASVSLLDMIVFTQGVSTIKPYERAEGDTAMELSYHEPHYSPFMYKSGLGITDGSLIEITFDVMFDSNEDSFSVNYRYNTSDVPTGRITKYFSAGKLGTSDTTYEADTWYSAKVIIDTYGNGYERFYVKGGNLEEYTLFAESSEFGSTGLNQVRFEMTNSSGGSYYLDNFCVNYRTIANTCSLTPSFENAEGETNAFSAGVSNDIKLKFSESVSGILADSVIIKNESGDKIGTTVSYDGASLTATVTPSKLNFGRKYFIEFANEIIADSGNQFYIGDPIAFETEGNPNGIANVLKTSSGVMVVLKSILSIPETDVRIVAVSLDNFAAKDINSTAVSIDYGDTYELNLEKTDNIKVYLYFGNELIDEVELF